jgi:DNA-binding beta-propeller fold protein YncE
MARFLLILLLTLAAVPRIAQAADPDVQVPAGFTVRTYVTGNVPGVEVRGIPSTGTLAFDDSGALYLGRTGRRYGGGEGDDLLSIFRIPAGGSEVTPTTERNLLHGPPLKNAQVAMVRGGREVFVSAFDRDRKIGVLYRLVDGRAEFFAGGSPAPGEAPLLRQPEGAAADAAGNVYVADREHGAVVRLDPSGRVLDARWVTLQRPRLLAMDETGHLWVAADGEAQMPGRGGPGEIWRVTPDAKATLVLSGPAPSGMAVGPGGNLFVADRQARQVFALTPDGRRIDLVAFAEGAAPRAVAFAPATPATRAARLAGDLFIVTIRKSAWQVNDVVRVSGPFEEATRPR